MRYQSLNFIQKPYCYKVLLKSENTYAFFGILQLQHGAKHLVSTSASFRHSIEADIRYRLRHFIHKSHVSKPSSLVHVSPTSLRRRISCRYARNCKHTEGLGNCSAEQFCKIVLPVLWWNMYTTQMNMQRGAGRCNRVQTKLCFELCFTQFPKPSSFLKYTQLKIRL